MSELTFSDPTTWTEVEIEAGSTGIHSCHYEGEWPSGRWWLADHGDLWPSRPILFRQAQTQEQSK